MADLNLNELERLEKAATPGPWKWVEKNSIDFGYVGPNGERTVLFGEDHEGAVHQDDPDGKFLAALRNALPELLHRLRAAEAELNAWKSGGSTGTIHQWREDAERWLRLCELWAASIDLRLRQDEEGTWSITQLEDVEGEVFQKLVGDTPDAAIDAARKP